MKAETRGEDSYKYNVHISSIANFDITIPKGGKTGTPPIIDGYQTKNGDRVLLLQQTNPIENGIYDVVSGYLYLADDSDSNDGYINGASVRVMNGTVNGLTEWYLAPITTKDFKTTPRIFIPSPFGAIANIQKNQISDITVPDGLTYITFGPDPVTGSINTIGTGNYVNITGDEDTIVRFDSAGYPTSSTAKLYSGAKEGVIKTQSFAGTPTGTVNGDWWFEDNGGTTYLCRQNSLGAIQKIQLL